MNNLLGADTAKNILSGVELSQEIPIKISEEKDMQVSQLYSLKPTRNQHINQSYYNACYSLLLFNIAE